jgi:pimeloyl-ACP methyl ester carboxylesterase
MRRDTVTRRLAPIGANLTVTAFADCGHYPMQEAPPLLVTTVERFLTSDAWIGTARRRLRRDDHVRE